MGKWWDIDWKMRSPLSSSKILTQVEIEESGLYAGLGNLVSRLFFLIVLVVVAVFGLTIYGEQFIPNLHTLQLSGLMVIVLATIAVVGLWIKYKRLEEKHQQLIKQLAKENVDLSMLMTVNTQISDLNREEFLNFLLKGIVSVLGADTGMILLKQENSFYIYVNIGSSGKMFEDNILSSNQNVGEMIASITQPLYIEDAQTECNLLAQCLKVAGVRTIMSVPLKHENNLIGLLYVNWLSIHPHNEREMRLLEITADRCAMALKITHLYQQTKQLQELLELQIDRMPLGFIMHDQDFCISDWNPAAEKIFGFTKVEVLGRKSQFIFPSSAQSDFANTLEKLRSGDIVLHNLNKNITKDGRLIICDWYMTSLKQADGKFMGYLAMVQDITERKQAEEQLQQYAFYDPLTGLWNQALFLERLEKLFEVSKQGKSGLFAVLFLELERFQMVKYSLGHEVADQLLIATARRLEICLRPNNQIARVGLNEFAILLKDLREVSDAISTANRIYQRLMSPFNLNGHEVFIGANIGIAPNSINYVCAEDFLRAADTAMHQAKIQTNLHYAVFDPAMQVSAAERLQLESDLRRALERQELRVYYQPIVSLLTGRIIGFEALVRWQHPTRGFISPVDFIPLAEEAGLINLIDQWVLQKACRQIAIWQQEFPAEVPLTISVNMAGIQLSQIGLITRLDKILRETGIERSSLKLELTEGVIMQNAAVSVAMLKQLKSLGIQLAIDDFGTGYSSLARLHQMPIDTLKIDRSFVISMGVDDYSLEIVRTIITLAHTLKMNVTAEGVETTEQLAQIRALQCEYGQGYFFSRPVDHETAAKLLAAQQIW